MIKQDLIDIVTKQITRFEVIDHTKKKGGRIVVEYNVNVELSLQIPTGREQNIESILNG